MAPEPKGGRKRATKKTAARASGTSEVVEESKPEIVEALIEEKPKRQTKKAAAIPVPVFQAAPITEKPARATKKGNSL